MTPGTKAIKTQAARSIRAAAPSALLVTLVCLLCTQVLDGLVSNFIPAFTFNDLIYEQGADIWITLFLTVLMTIFVTVMQVGYWSWSLGVARDRPVGYENLLDGFGMLGRVLLMEVLIFCRILCWSFVLAFGYAILVMVFSFSLSLVAALTVMFYLVLLSIVLRYELAPLLLCDYPEAGASSAVFRSAGMMRGHIWHYIKLHLSFWPWYLLIWALQIGLNVVFLMPSLETISSAYAAGGFDQIMTQVDLLLSSAAPMLATTLISLPVNLFFLPRRNVAIANFYRVLSGEPIAPQFSGESF